MRNLIHKEEFIVTQNGELNAVNSLCLDDQTTPVVPHTLLIERNALNRSASRSRGSKRLKNLSSMANQAFGSTDDDFVNLDANCNCKDAL